MKIKGTFTLRRIFPSLGSDDIDFLQKHSSVIKLKKGQNLFISGDSPRSIYAVANGCLKIVRESQDGGNVIMRIVGPGQIVGMREIFGETNYSRTSVSLKETEVFSIDKEAIFSLFKKNPLFSVQFLKIFCEEISLLEQRIEADLYKSAKTRVASVIYNLYLLFGSENSKTFEPPVNRKDISELADVTPETVSRAIADFKKNKVLEVRGATFSILDFEFFQGDNDN